MLRATNRVPTLQVLTAVVTHHSNYDGSNYGPRYESHPLPPDYLAYFSAFRSARDLKQALVDVPRTVPWFSIVRDTDSVGRVTINKDGATTFTYRMGRKDATSVVQGLANMVTLAEAAGADSVTTTLRGVEPLVFGTDRAAATAAYRARLLAAVDTAMASPAGCAHQLGSCRMAASPHQGAARPSGELWSTPGVWVADASLCPTATGVNPYFTVASLAYHVARRLQDDIDRFK